MGSFARLGPFVRPHAKQIGIAIGLAMIVAALWGANLSIAFPMVKVLVEGQSIDQYVALKLAESEEQIEHCTTRLNEIGKDEDKLETREKLQSKLSHALRTRKTMAWVNSVVVPFVPHDRFNTLAAILCVLMIATVIKGFAIYAQDVVTGSVVQLTVQSMREECFQRTLRLDHQTLTLETNPEILSRFTNDFHVLTVGLMHLGVKLVREPLKAVSCIALAFMVNWQLTLMSVLVLPLMALIFHRFGKSIKRASRLSMDSMSRIYKTLNETLESFKVVLAFNGGDRQRARFHEDNVSYYRKAMKAIRVSSLTSPTTEIMGLLAVSMAVLPGCYLVLRGTDRLWGVRLSTGVMDISELTLLYVALAGIMDPLRKLSAVYGKLKRASAAIDRVGHLLDLESQVCDPEHPKVLGRHSKSIVLDNISFSYPRRSESDNLLPALHEVDLRIEANEVVAVVGTNGSGKSTMVNLIPRFCDSTLGSVLIDGIDVRDVRQDDLRRQISIVTQETLLFDDSVYENIRYGNPDATREQIEAAADQAHVTQFLAQLPNGFETRIGERGSRLSGGQRQRIALARAIVRDPAILILDEATSAIDALSERLIFEVLQGFVKGRTVFVITHSMNPTLLEIVTKIVVLEQGKLVACGSHASLIESSPAYQRLYHSQVRKMAS